MIISTYNKVSKRYDRNAYTEGQLEYLTAYYEADGQCTFYLGGEGFLGNFGIEQKDREILRLFELWFGGTITPIQRKHIQFFSTLNPEIRNGLIILDRLKTEFHKQRLEAPFAQ